jgi:hypothetical protein
LRSAIADPLPGAENREFVENLARKHKQREVELEKHRYQVSRNGQLLSRRGHSSSVHASGIDAHRDSIQVELQRQQRELRKEQSEVDAVETSRRLAEEQAARDAHIAAQQAEQQVCCDSVF